MKLLLLTASLTFVSSFVAVPTPRVAPTALHAAAGKSDAEAHMDVMPKVWDELKNSERDLVVQQQVGELDETEASKAMAEKLLETALDYVRTKERIEEDLADVAHKTFEHASKEERVLKDAILEDDLLRDIPADSYVNERLHQALELEKDSAKEESEHLGKWAELRMEEEFIKSALNELKELDKVDPWADVEEFDM